MSHPLSSNFLKCFIINQVSSSQLPQSIDLIGLTAAVLELEYACFSGVEQLMISRLDPDELSSGESTIPEEVSGIDEYDAASIFETLFDDRLLNCKLSDSLFIFGILTNFFSYFSF